MVLEDNIFIEEVLPSSILRTLTEVEMAEYRRPYLDTGESRRPTLTWPRQVPVEGDPDDVNTIIGDYEEWMGENEIPKLFINAEPGALLHGPFRELVRAWPNLTEVSVTGLHFIQEDSPDEIGEAIAAWLTD